MHPVAAGVHDTLGNALVIEVEDLLAEVEIFDQRRAAFAGAQAVLVVGDGAALGGRQDGRVAFGDLVKFSTVAACRFLVMNGGRFRIVRRRGFLGHGSTPWSRADGHETLARRLVPFYVKFTRLNLTAAGAKGDHQITMILGRSGLVARRRARRCGADGIASSARRRREARRPELRSGARPRRSSEGGRPWRSPGK